MVLLLLVEYVLLPFSMVFLNLRMSDRLLDFLLVFLLGAIDLSFAGSFVSGLVMFSEGKTLLLSFLLFPVCMPVLIPSVLATDKILSGVAAIGVATELSLLLSFLLCIVAIAGLTFKFVLEE